MKILLTGGTGFIGKPLRRELIAQEHELYILTRAKKESSEKLNYIQWHWKEPFDLTDIINQVDIVINLAGEPVAKDKWTKSQKYSLHRSRIITTKLLADAINKATKKPKKFISASAVGIYGDRKNEKITEESSLGNDFLANICKEWEEEAKKVSTNLVLLRIGIVLGRDGGALEKILPPFKMFIGGPLGSGRQWMPWIALDDVIGLITFAMSNEKVSGILNTTSPNPVTNKEFSRTLGKVLFRPSFMPVPAFALKMLLGEMSELLLSGQKALPKRVVEYGYEFRYPELEDALRNAI